MGRRKTASARVRVTPVAALLPSMAGYLKIIFRCLLQQSPRVLPRPGRKGADVSVKVAGGGMSGQAEAVTHGIARALLAWNQS